MTNTTAIADGIYILHPEGGCWVAATYRDGKVVTVDEQASCNIKPSDADIAVPLELAGQIIADVLPDDDPAMVVVERLAPPVESRVCGGDGDDYDEGVVDHYEGTMAIVRWDSGVVSPAPAADLRAL